MYESPITKIVGDIAADIVKREEDCLMESVHKVGFGIDKEELVKALQYDRDQYEKGFKDGRLSAEPRWIPVTERLPEDGERVLLQIAEVCLYGDSYVEDYYYVSGSRSKGRWFINVHPDISVERGGITAWMPLPEPYERSDDA